jgi:hypothetical protein
MSNFQFLQKEWPANYKEAKEGLEQADNLFNSILQRAFKGELI